MYWMQRSVHGGHPQYLNIVIIFSEKDDISMVKYILHIHSIRNAQYIVMCYAFLIVYSQKDEQRLRCIML